MNVQINDNVITFMAHNLQTSYDLIKAKLLDIIRIGMNGLPHEIRRWPFNLCAMETP